MGENLIYVGDIFRRAGSSKNIDLTITGEEFVTSFARVIGDVKCDLLLESITNGIVVKGNISGSYLAKCGYGLEDFERDFSYEINEVFEHGNDLSLASARRSAGANNEDDAEEEDLYSFENADIDVTQMVIDTVMTNLPIAPVCSDNPEDCIEFKSEILPYVGKENLNAPKIAGNSSVIAHEVEGSKKIDPRWAALDDMFESLDLGDESEQ